MNSKVIAAVATAGFLCASARAQVNLNEGDIAIVGWCDACGTLDLYTFVPFVDLPAGTVIYFTDNGWTGRQYRGVTAENGEGGEEIAKFEVVSTIKAGTLITNGSNDPSYQWTVVGAIPFGGMGSFSNLALSPNGDQVCAFQSPTTANPMLNASKHLFVLDDTGAFEPAINANTSDVPPGLAAGTTALTFPQVGGTKVVMVFKTNVLESGTKQEWLAAMSDPENWIFEGLASQPEGSIVVIGGECGDGDGDGVCDFADACDGFDDSKDADQDGIPDGCDCFADLSSDGAVDGGDLGLLLGAWDSAGPGDLDGDGFVGGSDLGLLLGAWGDC